MDYGFSEDQEMLRKSFQDFFRKENPVSLVREIEEEQTHYSRGLYQKMAQLGWMGLMIPEEYGGSDGNWVDMAIFYEEAGKSLLQSPHYSSVVLGGQIILAMGTEEQKKTLLPKIASGELTLALAIIEGDSGSSLSLMKTSVANRGNDFEISGTKLFVSYAHTADLIITVTNTGKGITLFLVDRESPGLSCIPMYTMTGERKNEVIFDKVIVPGERILGGLDKGGIISEIIEKAKIMTCADMVGGAEVALQMSVDYSRERFQFGQPIGSYQALQHKMGRMSLAITGARWLTYYTAWLNSQGLPSAAEMAMAMAQLHVGEACRFVTAEATQIHGAMGVFQEHDLTLYFRRVKAAELNLGYPHAFQEIIAQSLGL
ncbi:acyl-CoA dehydrogenase family protein [Chloroflexota bacterium]